MTPSSKSLTCLKWSEMEKQSYLNSHLAVHFLQHQFLLNEYFIVLQNSLTSLISVDSAYISWSYKAEHTC